MAIVLEEIYQSAARMLTPLTPEETYRIIIEEAARLIDAEKGTMFLAENGVLHRVYSTVKSQEQVEPRENGFTYQCFREKKVIIIPIDEFQESHPEFKEKLKKTKMLYLVPLLVAQEAVGVIALRSRRNLMVSEKKMQILKLFGSLASLKLRNLNLFVHLQSALDARDRFISMATHELKTPITTVSGYLQLMEKNAQKKQPIKSEWFDEMKREIYRLTTLVDALLNIQQLKKGELVHYSWKAESFRKILNQALVETKRLHPHHEFTLIDQIGKKSDWFLGDDRRIQKVLVNICTNAAKFSPAAEPIQVTLSVTPEFLRFACHDHGDGVSKEDLANVFSEFHKGKAHTKAGIGLGLYLSRKIIEEHHGQISITSSKKRGTVVELQLPLFTV